MRVAVHRANRRASSRLHRIVSLSEVRTDVASNGQQEAERSELVPECGSPPIPL